MQGNDVIGSPLLEPALVLLKVPPVPYVLRELPYFATSLTSPIDWGLEAAL